MALKCFPTIFVCAEREGRTLGRVLNDVSLLLLDGRELLEGASEVPAALTPVGRVEVGSASNADAEPLREGVSFRSGRVSTRPLLESLLKDGLEVGAVIAAPRTALQGFEALASLLPCCLLAGIAREFFALLHVSSFPSSALASDTRTSCVLHASSPLLEI